MGNRASSRRGRVAGAAPSSAAANAPTCETPLEVLQSMGFPAEACTRALAVMSGDTTRALDWLLANANEAAGQQSRFGCRNPADGQAPGVREEDLEEDLPDYDYMVSVYELSAIASSFGSAPSSWPGTQNEYLRAMEDSTDVYLRWCRSSLVGGVRPNLQHHTDWLVSQMAACRPAFDQQRAGAEYAAQQHVQYSIHTLPQRYPGIFYDEDELYREISELIEQYEYETNEGLPVSRVPASKKVALVIERDRVVDSTVDQIGRAPDEGTVDAAHISIRFQGQGGIDAGGLTDDWLSMFMLEAMDPYRQPPLFLLPRQIDGLKEACCLRLNHSLHAFGITADREQAIMRTFGFVLAVCLKRGRFACNKYTLSKSLLQRLLGQDLPEGLFGLKEEFPEEYQSLEDLCKHPDRLEFGEKKYTACSRISDMYDLQSFLRDCIERSERQIDLFQQKADAEPQSPSAARDRVTLRQHVIDQVVVQCCASGDDSVATIKSAFSLRNEQLDPQAQFHRVHSGEIRAKLRELRSEAVSSHDGRVAALQSSITQQKRLIETLHAAEIELRRQRDERDNDPSDYTQSIVNDITPSTDVTELNFQEYCADVVQKHLCTDIEPMLQCMRQGFMAVYGRAEVELLRMTKVSDIQHKLFPLDPVTVKSFRENSNCPDCDDAKLMWKVMEEDLSPEQVQCVFYFATNWHTLNGAPRKVEVSFGRRGQRDERVLIPYAATCSWSLMMPKCIVRGDADSTESRERMKKGPFAHAAARHERRPQLISFAALLFAASVEALGYGFS